MSLTIIPFQYNILNPVSGEESISDLYTHPFLLSLRNWNFYCSISGFINLFKKLHFSGIVHYMHILMVFRCLILLESIFNKVRNPEGGGEGEQSDGEERIETKIHSNMLGFFHNSVILYYIVLYFLISST